MKINFLEEKTKKLQKLLDISLYLGSTLDLKELLNRITNAFKEVLNTEDASIMLYNEEEDKLYFYQLTNLADEIVLKEVILKMGEGIAGYVAETKESLIVNDVQKDGRHDKRADKSTGKTTKNLIAIPVKYQERFIGVMEGINKIEGDFNEVDLKLALSFGNIAAVALENAKLHEETSNNLKRIKELEEAKSEFISVISHELNTPITPIQGYLDMILSRFEQLGPDNIRNFLEVIKGRVSHLHMLIKDLFIVNEVHELRTNLYMKEVDIRNIINEKIKLWDKEKATHKIILKEGENIKSFKIEADPDKLGHSLYHLLDNAGKFSEMGKTINILLDKVILNDKDFIQIIIKDEGIGIEEEYQEKIFDNFFQISAGSTREYGGLGIGLFICKKIIDVHNGNIFCRSKPGEGSQFYIQIPMHHLSTPDKIYPGILP